MHATRPGFATDPKLFGKGPARDLAEDGPAPMRWGDDLKLFATTFIAGFVAISILIG